MLQPSKTLIIISKRKIMWLGHQFLMTIVLLIKYEKVFALSFKTFSFPFSCNMLPELQCQKLMQTSFSYADLCKQSITQKIFLFGHDLHKCGIEAICLEFISSR